MDDLLTNTLCSIFIEYTLRNDRTTSIIRTKKYSDEALLYIDSEGAREGWASISLTIT